MDVSMSKGVYPFKGNYKIRQRSRKINNNFFCTEPWYEIYEQTWVTIKNSAEKIFFNMFKQILSDLQNYVGNIRDNIQDNFSCEIPTAILLTGINLPDHDDLFCKLKSKLSSITRQIAVVQSRDSSNLRNLIEEMIFQLVKNSTEENVSSEVKKNQCTFKLLETWYFEKCDINTPLVIIIPDFESFTPAILRDFILVLSSYAKTMKFVLVFGVATTLHAIHRSLSYDVTSKLRVQVFHTRTQFESLSDILNGTVLSRKIPFKITGGAFRLLTDVFIFCDFSVNNFLQGYKLCLLQHFYGNNLMGLCCQREKIVEQFDKLTEDELDELKKMSSINKYFERTLNDKCENIGDEEFKNIIIELLNKFHDSMGGFFPILQCFHYLTYSLPGTPMGKQLREVYASAVTCDLTEMQEFKECMHLLKFLSKEELILKLKKLLEIIKNEKNDYLNDVVINLENHLKIIRDASLDMGIETSEKNSTPDKKLNRRQWKENLLKKSQEQSISPFKQAQTNLMNYLEKLFTEYLINPNRLPASEIFCFSDATIARHFKGSLRAAIHTGLNDPQRYLNCSCCKLENEETIQFTMPDLSIIYKLHLESRKLINMYDWLQAFVSIVDPTEEPDEQREIDPKIQARFTRGVAELQFLGFIKTSRKKTDHVKRLT